MAKLDKAEWTEIALAGFLIALIAWVIYHGGQSMSATDQSTVPPFTPPETGGVPNINLTAPYYPPETFTANPVETFQPMQITTLGTPPLIFINVLGQPTTGGDCNCCQSDGNCNSIVSAPPLFNARYDRAA